jgi:competence protein ComEC
MGSEASELFVIKSHTTNFYSSIQNFRNKIYEKILDTFTPITANFVSALLIGESKAIDRNVMTDIRYAGISHLLCVSGLHLSLIAVIFFKISRFILNIFDFVALRFNIKILAGMISFFCTVIYWLLTGVQIAATRAFIMNTIVILALLTGRKINTIRSLNLACTLLLIFNPDYVVKASFQLSFLAVLSIILASEFYDFLKSRIIEHYSIFTKVKLYFYNSICFSLLVNFATGPVCIYNFFVFSNYSLITNLIAVPITLFFIIPLIIISIILLPFPNIAQYPIHLIEISINYIITLSKFVVNLYGSVTYFGYITSTSLLIYLFGFFWLCIWQQKWRFFGVIIMFFALILMLQSPKPVIIINIDDLILAAQNKNKELEIFSMNMSNFQKRYWKDWFGQKEIILHKINPAHQNWFFEYKNKKIAILFNNDYAKTDDMLELVINTNPIPSRLKAKTTLSDAQVKASSGNILIYCDDDKCQVK